MADKSKLGTKYHFKWQVERGKIAELVAAIGDKNPIYTDTSAAKSEGYSNIVAPPTFTTVPLMWSGVILNAFRDLQIPISKIMHAEQSYEFYREILLGDILTGELEIKSITEKRGKSGSMDFILFEIMFRNQDGQLLLKEDLLIVVRE